MTDFNARHVQRYLNHRMDETELDAFEEAMLASPALLSRVEEERNLREGLRVLEERGQLPDMRTPGGRGSASAGTAGAPSFLAQLGAFIQRPAWSYSASALALALAVTLAVPGESDPEPGGFVVDDVVYLAQTRSSAAPVQRMRAQSRSMLVLDIPGTAEPLRVTLRKDAALIQSITDVLPNDDGQVNLVIGALDAGLYDVEVSNSGGLSQRYRLDVAAR